MEINIKIAGEAGHGLFSLENEITQNLFILGYYFFTTKNYMSRIRGGHNYHMIRIADFPVHALSGKKWDLLVALDETAETRHAATLNKKSCFINFEKYKEILATAKEKFSDIKAVNKIVAGIILAALGQLESTDEQIRAGYEFAKKWRMEKRFLLKPNAEPSYRFNGNQALAFGAMLGGCQFMAGYPMTPATSIMDYFSNAEEKLPIHFEQVEDEISALNTALGASFAGLRSMVATSGGGFALMQEGVSLAGMTETPIVIVDSQRPGPATGLPTRTEQSDLNFVLYSGHGEFPKAVFAPGSIAEAITIAKKSFDLADKAQTPIIILTDQYLADSQQLIEKNIELAVAQRKIEGFASSYKRYALAANGVSPLTYPGISEAIIRVDSDEHDEEGRITEDLAVRIKMNNKRLKKIKILEKEFIQPTFAGLKSAKNIIISWGSNKAIVEEAISNLQKEKMSIASLHFSQVFPLPQKLINTYQLNKKKIITIENNATGQFAKLLKRELGITSSTSILKHNGECFTVDEIKNSVLKRLKK